MGPLPPLPQGFSLAGGAPPPDPYLLKPMFDLGIEATNGYRTAADIQRLQAAGYHPAPNTLHRDGDAVDLVPGKSGLTLAQIKAQADAIAARWPHGRALNEGDHVHLQMPGWGMAPGTPGTPNFGLPPLPPGATLAQRGALHGSNFSTPHAALNSSTALTPIQLTGQAHDGDTVGLTNGRNGRLFGADAFELNQEGRNSSGQLMPLGKQARDFMLSQTAPGMFATPTGATTFGRPVITLSNNPYSDPAYGLLASGLGMAEPGYLKGSPQFPAYMQAERLARLNHQGGFQTNAETPSQFRHNNGPWKSAEPGVYGQGAEAFFWDDPTPFQGLRPEIAKSYRAAALAAKTPEDLRAAAQSFGLDVPLDAAAKWLKQRDAAKGNVAPGVQYLDPPRPTINPGDGTFGSYARGFGDPINALDELGGIADTLGATRGRENLWNSNRRFGDVLWNNIDQNRAILAHDEEAHPYARTAGQLTSGVALPMGAATTPLRLGAVMAAEGGLAGFMGGEGDIKSRIPGAALGTIAGAVAGPILGLAGEHLINPLIRKGANMILRRGAVEDVGAAAVDNLPPTPPGFTVHAPPPQSAAMAADRGSELVGPLGRQPDFINVHDLPPVPQGFALQ